MQVCIQLLYFIIVIDPQYRALNILFILFCIKWEQWNNTSLMVLITNINI